MVSEQMKACAQQKLILMTNIFNITKQIEVRCSQPEINLGDLLDKRQVFLERLEKCNRLISKMVNELPKPEKERMQHLLKGDAEMEDRSADERELQNSARQWNDYLSQTIELNNNASDYMKRQCDDIKDEINNQRRSGSNQPLYNIR
jgi:hypothetical protein